MENSNFITWSFTSRPPFSSFTNQFLFWNGNHLVYINCSSNEVGLLVIRILGYLIILKHRNNQSCCAAQAGGGNHNLYFNLFIFQHAMMFPCRELCLDGGNININISGSSGLSRSAKFFTEMNPCSKLKPWCTSIKECLRWGSSYFWICWQGHWNWILGSLQNFGRLSISTPQPSQTADVVDESSLYWSWKTERSTTGCCGEV